MGNPYFVRVYTASDEPVNVDFNLCISQPPINDNCSNATIVNDGEINYATNAASTADGCLADGYVNNNVWFQWCAPASWTGDAYVNLFDQQCNISSGLQMTIYNADIGCSQLDCQPEPVWGNYDVSNEGLNSWNTGSDADIF